MAPRRSYPFICIAALIALAGCSGTPRALISPIEPQYALVEGRATPASPAALAPAGTPLEPIRAEIPARTPRTAERRPPSDRDQPELPTRLEKVAPAKGPPGGFAVVNGEAGLAPTIPMGDRATIERVIDEGWNRSQVRNHLAHLTRQIGPRLTGSTRARLANEWTAEQFRAWGLSVDMKQWGTVATRWDRGEQWGRVLVTGLREGQRQRFRDARDGSQADVLADRAREQARPIPDGALAVREIEFSTLAWSAGTSGPVRGGVVRMPQTMDEYNAIKDKVKGSWVLIPRTPWGASREGVMPQRMSGQRSRWEQRQKLRDMKTKGEDLSKLDPAELVMLDGPLGYIDASSDDRVWTSGAPGWRDRVAGDIPSDLDIKVRLSDYDFISARLTDGDPIELEFDLPVAMASPDGGEPVYNTIAEIRGTEKPDEVVIVCGHLDSWNGPGSQGATDNGTGSSVTLEAARILMAAGAKPKRTIRFALWTGEEQGLLGARAYVKQIESEWPKISAVFNDDGGTNHQGGLAVVPEMVPMLAAATAPLNGRFYSATDNAWLDVNLRVQETFSQIAGSDHFAFVEKNIPGFFWDEVGRADYGYSWHTQHDRYERGIDEYLKQSAICAAVTAYNIACAPDLLPRWTPEERGEPTPTQIEGGNTWRRPGETPVAPAAAPSETPR